MLADVAWLVTALNFQFSSMYVNWQFNIV